MVESTISMIIALLNRMTKWDRGKSMLLIFVFMFVLVDSRKLLYMYISDNFLGVSNI